MQVGVRELQSHTTAVLREVVDRRKSVEITRRGRVIAKLVPVDDGLTEGEKDRTRRILAEIDQLAEQINAKWPDGVSAVEAVRQERR